MCVHSVDNFVQSRKIKALNDFSMFTFNPSSCSAACTTPAFVDNRGFMHALYTDCIQPVNSLSFQYVGHVAPKFYRYLLHVLLKIRFHAQPFLYLLRSVVDCGMLALEGLAYLGK